jgi:hypothetical protein
MDYAPEWGRANQKIKRLDQFKSEVVSVASLKPQAHIKSIRLETEVADLLIPISGDRDKTGPFRKIGAGPNKCRGWLEGPPLAN